MVDNNDEHAIAIVGMSCVYPGAPDLETFWQNIHTGFDAISDVPEDRWESVFFDPRATEVDRVYCRRGGFIDQYATFDPLAFGIMPVEALAAEPDQLLSLKVAARALVDAGCEIDNLPTKRIGVILGRGGYMTPGVMRMVQKVRIGEQLVHLLRTLLPSVSENKLLAIKKSFHDQISGVRSDTVIGLVPNLAASRIANRLDLHGPAYTVDGACASSLLAVDQSCQELIQRRCDLMLAGGMHLTQDVGFWSVFCQLGAMSRKQQIRPFDQRADGLLIGEGVGIVVLKRLADARQDRNRIYAVIRGRGVASDGRGTSLMEPSVAGQIQAMKTAWLNAQLDPLQVGLVEAHGAGTVVGDACELASLGQVFGPAAGVRQAGLGSIKSMIGHTMPAAGAAALIKASLAIYHKVKPPSLHCQRPKVAVQDTRFRIVQEAEPWEDDDRICGVNAFGFGGINVHLVLQSEPVPKQRKKSSGHSTVLKLGSQTSRLYTLAAESSEDVLEALQRGEQGGQGPARLAILNPSDDKFAKARKILQAGKRWSGRDGIWFATNGLLTRGGQVAFLFPGLDAVSHQNVDDVADFFGQPRLLAPNPNDLGRVGYSIIQESCLFEYVIRKLGVHPEAIAGHSIGEWSGMIASGMIPREQIEALMDEFTGGMLEVPGVIFAAAGCGLELASQAINGLEQIVISHDNCPHQVILCGTEKSIRLAIDRLKKARVLCHILPFRSGFHSPWYADYLGLHRKHFSRLGLREAQVTMWSATTCEPYPDEPDSILRLVLDHLIKPVRFRELTLRLYQEGFRVFLQLGSGSLTGFVNDTLHGREHVCVSSNAKGLSGMEQLRNMVAALYVEGAQVNLAPLWPKAISTQTLESSEIKIQLGNPLVTLPLELTLANDEKAFPETDDPILRAFGNLQHEMLAVNREVFQAFTEQKLGTLDNTQSGQFTEVKKFRRKLSVQIEPALIDHSLIPQPKGWTDPSDCQPVVPLTMNIALMIEAAQQVVPDRIPIRVQNVRAIRWLEVEPEIEMVIKVLPWSRDLVQVDIEGFAQAQIVFADTYPPAQNPQIEPVANPQVSAVDAETIYADGWMFHGPQYQGIVELGPLDDRGIQGVVKAPVGPGALLDNAGQLFGYWVMAKCDLDSLAMPIQIKGIDFFGPMPTSGSVLDCRVQITKIEGSVVIADLELISGQTVWCRIKGWEDRRFPTNQHTLKVMRQPGRQMMSRVHPGGFMLFALQQIRMPSYDWLRRRYLCRNEREQMKQVDPRHSREWLNGQIVAKDAVRQYLWQKHNRPIYPVEVTLENTQHGNSVVHSPFDEKLYISVSSSRNVAVALVASDKKVGIDLEKVEERPESFAVVAFTKDEQRLIENRDRHEWLTRLWCAKEAVAQCHQSGLEEISQKFTVTKIKGESFLVDDQWVETTRFGEYIIAWTEY